MPSIEFHRFALDRKTMADLSSGGGHARLKLVRPTRRSVERLRRRCITRATGRPIVNRLHPGERPIRGEQS